MDSAEVKHNENGTDTQNQDIVHENVFIQVDNIELSILWRCSPCFLKSDLIL